jgi:hypothetical protein
VATEIIEWELGRATQKAEVTGANGGPLVIAIGGLDPQTDI